MSLVVPLERVPNQSFSVRLGDSRYSITLKDVGGIMVATIERDSGVVIRNTRCVAGFPLLPYTHQYAADGNLIFTHATPETIPHWTDFGVTCWLVYSTAAEIAAAVLPVDLSIVPGSPSRVRWLGGFY